MPLRDHFRSPVEDRIAWEGFHAQWIAMMVLALNRHLPSRYIAVPRVRLGVLAELDVATFDDERVDGSYGSTEENGRGVATATWTPPTLTVEADLPKQYEYEVQISDTEHGRRLVAAVELVSPANKDRSEHRRAFVAKCAALLQQQVCVCMVDLVTTRRFNLYAELLELIGRQDPALLPEPPSIYGATCRGMMRRNLGYFDAWLYPLSIGAPLPTLPLWLSDDVVAPLELEDSYEETCRALRLP